MAFEFYDTSSFEFYDTTSFGFDTFYDTDTLGVVAVNEYLFLFPNWAQSVYLRKEWRTSILRSLTGKETRSEIITSPVRSLRYALLNLSTYETNLLKRKIYKNLHNIWGIPYWMDSTPLLSLVSIGDITISVDTTNRNFYIGGLCVILKSETEYEVKTISMLDAATITVNSPAEASWNIGTNVYPILKSTLNSTQNFSYLTDIASEISLEFTEILDISMPFSVTSIEWDIYKTHDLFPLYPNFQSEISLDISRDIEQTVFYGVQYRRSYQEESNIKIANKYLFDTKVDAPELISFFDQKMGMYESFWLPSYLSDIVITDAFLSTDTVFSVENVDWDNYWLDNVTTGKFLNFRFPNGTNIQKQILEEDTPGSITLTEAIGVACSAAELPMLTVSFLYLVRFNMDALDLEYVTNEIVQAEVSFSTLNEAVL